MGSHRNYEVVVSEVMWWGFGYWCERWAFAQQLNVLWCKSVCTQVYEWPGQCLLVGGAWIKNSSVGVVYCLWGGDECFFFGCVSLGGWVGYG